MIVVAARMGMLPDSFWVLTPFEFYLQQQAFMERCKDEQRLLAWHACNVMQPHVKKRMHVDMLLGERHSLTEMDVEDRKEFMERFKKEQRHKSRQRR